MINQYLEFIYQQLNTIGDFNLITIVILFCVITVTEFGVPVPLVLQSVRFYLGYKIGQGSLSVLFFILLFIAGRQLGSGIIYWVARLSSATIVRWFPKRFYHMLKEVDKLRAKLRSKTFLAVGSVIIGRFTPGLLLPTSIASGGIGLPYGYFVLGVFISSFIFDTTFITLAALFGREVKYHGFTGSSWLILACFIGLACSLWIIRWLRKRRDQSNQRVIS